MRKWWKEVKTTVSVRGQSRTQAIRGWPGIRDWPGDGGPFTESATSPEHLESPCYTATATSSPTPLQPRAPVAPSTLSATHSPQLLPGRGQALTHRCIVTNSPLYRYQVGVTVLSIAEVLSGEGALLAPKCYRFWVSVT